VPQGNRGTFAGPKHAGSTLLGVTSKLACERLRPLLVSRGFDSTPPPSVSVQGRSNKLPRTSLDRNVALRVMQIGWESQVAAPQASSTRLREGDLERGMPDTAAEFDAHKHHPLMTCLSRRLLPGYLSLSASIRTALYRGKTLEDRPWDERARALSAEAGIQCRGFFFAAPNATNGAAFNNPSSSTTYSIRNSRLA